MVVHGLDGSHGGLPKPRESTLLCDYSLQHAQSRDANVGDRLVTNDFGSGTRGFADPADLKTAVCLRPGTEIAFELEVRVISYEAGCSYKKPKVLPHKIARFRQVSKDNPYAHHDALEFPNGTIAMLTRLVEGQRATVLQLPADPKTAAEKQEQTRAEYV